MNDQGLDMLNGAPAKGQVSSSEKGGSQPEVLPEQSGDAMSKALVYLPESVQLRVATIAARFGIDPKADPIYAVVESVDLGAKCAQAATAAAFAAGDAAAAVQAGIQKIPDQIWDGAVRASDEVKGGLIAGGKLFAEAFTKAANDRQVAFDASAKDQQKGILDAANLGAEKIKTAAVSLTSSLDKAVQAKTAEGVADFARAAAVAGKAAASHALYAQMSRSIVAFGLAFILACGIGAGGLWGFLLLTDRVMPAGVVAMADPMRGGAFLRVPGGGHEVKCSAALCVVYKSGIPDMP